MSFPGMQKIRQYRNCPTCCFAIKPVYVIKKHILDGRNNILLAFHTIKTPMNKAIGALHAAN